MRIPFCLYGSGGRRRTKIRGNLADLRFIGAADDDVRLLIDRNLNPLGDRKLDRVGLAEREGDDFALHFGAVTDADDVELFLETLGNAENGVGQQGAGQPVERAVFFVIANGREHAVFLLQANLPGHQHVKLALGALHFDLTGVVLIFTPAGTGIGLRPIRDIFGSLS